MFDEDINKEMGWFGRSVLTVIAWPVDRIERWYWRRKRIRERWRRMREWKRFHPF